MATTEFTLHEYEALLRLALGAGYAFCPIEELGAEPGKAQIFLRHDIDYGPRFMVEMAELEARTGIHSTYCVQLDSPWYRIDSPESDAAVRTAIGHGHRLGVHLDATRIDSDDEACERAREHAVALEERFGVAVRAVSFHMPGRREVTHLELPGDLINTYAPRFFGEIGYLSDSNQSWRGADPREEIRSRRHERLQVLIHPFWWRREPGALEEKISALAGDLGVAVEEIITPEQTALMADRSGT